MALQTLTNKFGYVYHSALDRFAATNVTLDASGESRFTIGRVFLAGGSGSKTISAAGGGIIHWYSAGVTLADAASNLRIGIQDVAATGLEDGTFDVYGDYTSAGAPAANTFLSKAMGTGTKTISHGDEIAIGLELTARGGSDTVAVRGYAYGDLLSNASNYPYTTVDAGAGPARNQTAQISAVIEFDDDTLGWIEPGFVHPNVPNVTATSGFNTGSTPDEYAGLFQIPFKCRIRGCYSYVGSLATTDNFEMILYSDAEGTPVAERTIAIDPNYTGSASAMGQYWRNFATPFTLTPSNSQWYAIAIRPTTANSITYGYLDLTTGYNHFKTMFPFGTTCKMSSRSNQTGAFTEVQTYFQPRFGLIIDQLDDGSGGGQRFHTF